MHLKIANNSHLKPSMHKGKLWHDSDYSTGGPRLNRKQPVGPQEILRTAKKPTA
jgi:hypothetical protein